MGGAFAIICDEKRRVLLCHRRDIDAWNLPGGRVEEGEAPWDAAIRETREEVGLEVEVTRLTGLYWRPEKVHLPAGRRDCASLMLQSLPGRWQAMSIAGCAWWKLCPNEPRMLLSQPPRL